MVLARFVTSDIAGAVCRSAFEGMGRQNPHNQLRYFIEVFTIQCARAHPLVFGKELVLSIRRTDLCLQMLASLMIVSGNLVVGRYQSDFFVPISKEESGKMAKQLLAGVVRWLSSTQGFSRAIAQLLVHKLVPLVVDFDNTKEGSDWYLRSIFEYLEANDDMMGLRQKQAKFFDTYEVDSVCTPEGVFAIPIDEGNEASPQHMIDVIKATLKEVYEEVHIDDSPLWKRVEHANAASTPEIPRTLASSDDEVNFQRKIIPLDALNLALEDMAERRLRNIAGRKKQNLVVCASLIDKATNLGGLARTSEIFAADRLVIPDMKISKMDNFKAIAAGAQDWIEFEECRERVSTAALRVAA